MRLRKVAISFLIAAGASVVASSPAAAYRVRPGDTLWGISQRTHIPIGALAARNHLANPNRIYAGQDLALSDPAPPPAPAAAPSVSPDAARQLLIAAARERGLRPSFVLAVADWESGFNQSKVSKDGAVGLMQIMPATAAWAGPALLGRPANINDPRDNARMGAGLLRRYLDEFDDPKLALAAYYQGAASVHKRGVLPSSRGYVDGIWALRNRFEAGAR